LADVPLAFSPDRYAHLRGHARQVHAHLTLRSEVFVISDRVYSVYREFLIHDEDNRVIERRREAARDGQERIVATVKLVEPVDVLATEDQEWGRALTLADATDCGYRTVGGLRAAWKSRHREDFAQIVYFVLGDWRDRDLFMQFAGLAGGDYTRNWHRALDPDAPILTPEQYSRYGMANRQKDARRMADAATTLADETPAQTIARIEAAGPEAVRKVSSEMAIIGQRIHPYEKRLAAKD
jgi:hypothetical protein